jgi:zinc protease
MVTRIHALMLVFGLCVAGCDPKTDKPADKAEPAAKEAGKGDPKASPDAKADEVAADLPTATDLLDKAVEAQGGRAKFDAISSLYLEGTTEVSAQKIKGDMKLWWKDGDFYIEQQMIGIGTQRAGKQGDVLWIEDPISGLRKLSGAEAEQHAWASSPSLTAQWKRYFDKAETVAAREHGGNKVYDVKLTSKTGATVTLTFDAESGLQVVQAFKQVTPLGDVPLTIELGDYREVDGIKLPHSQVIDLKVATATQTLTKVEIGAEVDSTKFAMPTGGTAVVKPTPKPEPKPAPPIP